MKRLILRKPDHDDKSGPALEVQKYVGPYSIFSYYPQGMLLQLIMRREDFKELKSGIFIDSPEFNKEFKRVPPPLRRIAPEDMPHLNIEKKKTWTQKILEAIYNEKIIRESH